MFKKITRKIHLWLGLSVGFLIVIISFTGMLYVFKDEIENFSRKAVIKHHEPNIENKQLISIQKLEQLVKLQVPEKYPLHWVNIPIDPSMSYVFYYYEHNLNAWNYFDEYSIYKSVYVNPYTGKILASYDEKNGFFAIVKSIHWSFLLKASWGKYVVGIPVLIFLVLLISGIILWWPRNKAARKQRFWFNWKNVKTWKRKNYDLHNILGFYSSLFALIVTITGLFYAFFTVQALIYFTFSGGKTQFPDFSNYKTTSPISERNETTLDSIAQTVKTLYPKAFGFSIDLGHPHLDDHEHPNFSIFVKHLSYSYHKSSSLIFDENSGKLLHRHDPWDKNFGEKVVAANYDIHVGSIMGLPTKIIAFILSAICTSLPITGFYIWWNRKKKNKAPTKKL